MSQEPHYIVVGAGAAGGVMAARLSEDREKRVLLFEAGVDYERDGSNEGLPDAILYGYGNPGNPGPAEVRGHHWYPEPADPCGDAAAVNAGGLYGYTGSGDARHAVDIPRGRIVGGTTSVNSQMWVRGTTDDFDYWSTELGCESWSFDSVLPFFNSIENDVEFGREAYHGDSGPITVRRHPRTEWREADVAWYNACINRGFESCADVNAPGSPGGVGSLALNNVDRVRQSSALTFLAGARERPNLTIRGDAEVRRVLFDRRSRGLPLATAVELMDGSVLHASVEVILCGGAIASPHLLLRSGVGPADELTAAGIEPLVDLPGVGKSLRDHPAARLAFRMREDIAPDNMDGSSYPMPLYLRYTAEPAAETAALANDLMLYPGPLQSRAGSAPTSAGDRTFMIQATLMLGLSAGTVTLAPPKPDGTPDVEAMPVIEMGWLTHEADRIRLRDAMRLSLQLAESAEMSTVIERPIAPAADEVNSESADSVFDSWIASNVVSSQHQTSTCRMGGPHDPQAVCDEEGRVFGTEGLRVVDASLMPDCPRANTQATTYMIGERIARIINAGSLETAIRAVSQSTS